MQRKKSPAFVIIALIRYEFESMFESYEWAVIHSLQRLWWWNTTFLLDFKLIFIWESIPLVRSLILRKSERVTGESVSDGRQRPIMTTPLFFFAFSRRDNLLSHTSTSEWMYSLLLLIALTTLSSSKMTYMHSVVDLFLSFHIFCFCGCPLSIGRQESVACFVLFCFEI